MLKALRAWRRERILGRARLDESLWRAVTGRYSFTRALGEEERGLRGGGAGVRGLGRGQDLPRGRGQQPGQGKRTPSHGSSLPGGPVDGPPTGTHVFRRP